MADLALPEESFFETPADVAEDLAALLAEYLTTDSSPLLVDACAGAGALALASLRVLSERKPEVALIEINPSLLSKAAEACGTRRTGSATPIDVFSREAAELIGQADAVLLNPPFAGARGGTFGPTLAGMQDDRRYPDVGCHYILHIAERMRPGVPLAFIFRKDAFVSRAYQGFWSDFAALGSVLRLVGVHRRLRPTSGAAESLLGVFVREARTDRCWLRRRAAEDFARTGQLLRLGWRRLGSVAYVRAGPSIRNELKRAVADHFPKIVRVIDIPPLHDGLDLWGPSFSYDMDWNPAAFSVPRNLTCQGRPGFVYRLAASEFRTAVLPRGFHFISATPAVMPRKPYDLHFVTGCSLVPAWRQLVRSWIASSNFTPGAVEDVLVPFSSFGLYRSISQLGRQVREILYQETRVRRESACSIPLIVLDNIKRVDAAVRDELKVIGGLPETDSLLFKRI